MQVDGITAIGRRFVDREFIDEFHDCGLQYFVWTINDPKRIPHYRSLGADGVIADDPAAFHSVSGSD